MIHPENCTREELVYFITHSMFYDKLKFDSSIKDYRDSKNTKLAHNAFEIADKCMKECAELEKNTVDVIFLISLYMNSKK